MNPPLRGVIGAGRARLSIAKYRRRAKLGVVLLVAEPGAGGGWRPSWETLRLFPLAGYSSIRW